MTNGNILVLDVGGSFLKYGVADQQGALSRQRGRSARPGGRIAGEGL